MLQDALTYAAAGWRVLPLHIPLDRGCSCVQADCTSPGKHPRNEKGCLAASTHPEQIRTWWSMWPDSNVGIATGEMSNLVVVDADGEEGISSLQRELHLQSDTQVSTGGGGMHQYFSWPNHRVSNSSRKIAAGIDIRGEGGYVVAPPSKHHTGRPYAWVSRGTLTPYPLLESSGGRLGSGVQGPVGLSLSDTERIGEGSRNQTLTSVAGRFRRQGLSEAELVGLLEVVNSERCDPPLPLYEVHAIARSGARYPVVEPITVPDIEAGRIEVTTLKRNYLDVTVEQHELLGPLLAKGNRLVIAGHTGHGKTSMAFQMLKAVTETGVFLNWATKTTGHRALIVDAEQGKKTIQRRTREARLTDSEIDLVRVPDGLDLANDETAETLEQVFSEGHYDVVVLDPLYKLHQGESSDEREIITLMRRLDRWRERYQFALVLLAHCRKPREGIQFTIHDVFGSTAILRGAEVVLGIERKEKGHSRVHFFKDRDGDLPVGDSMDLSFDQLTGFRPWSDGASEFSTPF